MLRSLALAATVAACAALAPARRAPPRRTALRAEGLHGDQSCFLPLQQLDDLSRWPRLLRVAGVYPGLTADEVAAPPPPAPAPEAGSWNYEFPDAHGADYGVVAVPGSDIVHGLADPVAVIASSGSLGLMIPEKEVLLVLDRGDTWYEERQFFAYADGAGNVSIRRMDGGYGEDAPDGYTIAGRVGVINLPYDAATMASSGTWLEDGDADM